MKRRRYEAWFLIVLVCCSSLSNSLAKGIPRSSRANSLSSPALSSVEEERAVQHQRVKRQSDGFQSIIQLGLKMLPFLMDLFTGSSSGHTKPSSTDRIEELDLQDGDRFSWTNLLSMGMKIALTLISSYTSGGIDKSDVSPTEAVLGTMISAMTGSQDPSEVSLMAKQATDVLNLLMSLVEALQTSFSSR